MEPHQQAIDHFDGVAADWDQSPTRVAIARSVAHHIDAYLGNRPVHTLLDFGCGTGLISLYLYELVQGRIVATDTSPAMLNQLEKKILEQGLMRIEPRLIRDEQAMGEWSERFDLIASSMTLHHVANTLDVLSVFFALLHSGGRIALADLDSEDGTFHPVNTGVMHFGFERDDLGQKLTQVGFTAIDFQTVYEVEREADPTRDLPARTYPVFLVTAIRP